MASESKLDHSDGVDPRGLSTGQDVEGNTVEYDAVFGAITEDGPNYRNVGWVGSTALMIKTQIGLGVLSMPAIFDTFGIVPGNIILVIVACITTWSDYMVGVFKANHPEVYGVDDVGRMLFGRIGYEIFGAAYCLFYTLCAGSAMIGISTALNALSDHGTCTAVFVAVAAVIAFTFSSIRTLSRISWIAWVGSLCIIIAVFVLTIGVGVQGKPSGIADGVEWKSDWKVVNNPSFTEAISGVSTLIFTYAGTGGFFNIVAEMRDPRQYNKALTVCQITVTVIYIIIGSIVYYYAGSHVASPALGTAGRIIKKISYGIALPGLIASGVLLSHLSSKHIFMRAMRGSKHLVANTPTHWMAWLGSTAAVSITAYIFASAIPVFSGLVSLAGALFGTLLTFQPYGGMWLYDNWHKGKADRKITWCFGVAWSIFMIVGGTFLMIAGTYGSIVGIIDSYRATGGSSAWSCADNSNSS